MCAMLATRCARSTAAQPIERGGRRSRHALRGKEAEKIARAMDREGRQVPSSARKVAPEAIWTLAGAAWMPLSALAEDLDENVTSEDVAVTTYAVALAPIALYGVFYLLRSTVYPKIKLGDYVFFLASTVVVGNILSILIFKVMRL